MNLGRGHIPVPEGSRSSLRRALESQGSLVCDLVRDRGSEVSCPAMTGSPAHSNCEIISRA